jgi:ornithine carbamoyltransferase
MADYLTIFESKGRVADLKVAFLGDGNNVAHSQMFAGAQLAANVWVASPPGYEPDQDAVDWAFERSLKTGGSVTITNDPLEAALDADVVYTDVWISMGQEAEREKRLEAFQRYQLNDTLLGFASPKALVMHCLPAHRGEEVTDAVLDGPRSIVLDQAENRLHIQKGIVMHLSGATA